MAPLLHTLLRLTAFQSPFLRTLLPSIGLAYGIQAAVAIPSILATTERFYDLSGSLTYISCVALSLYLPTLRARAAAAGAKGVGAIAGLGAGQAKWPSLLDSLMGRGGVNVWNWRQVVLSAAVVIWATRCECFGLIDRERVSNMTYPSNTSFLSVQWEPFSSSASLANKAATPASTACANRHQSSSAHSWHKRHG